MRAIFFGVALTLAACGQTATTTTAANAPPALDLSDKPMAPAAAQYGATELVGRWGDNGDCSKSLVQFNADGTFHSFDNNTDGRWTLNDDHLTMQGAGGTFELGLHWLDANRMDVLNGDGSVGHSQRC